MDTKVEQELRQGITELGAEVKVAKAEHESAFDRVHSGFARVQAGFDRVHAALDGVLSVVAGFDARLTESQARNEALAAENKAAIQAAIAENRAAIAASEARLADRIASQSTLIVGVLAAVFTGMALLVALLAYLGWGQGDRPPSAATRSQPPVTIIQNYPSEWQFVPAKPPAPEAAPPAGAAAKPQADAANGAAKR